MIHNPFVTTNPTLIKNFFPSSYFKVNDIKIYLILILNIIIFVRYNLINSIHNFSTIELISQYINYIVIILFIINVNFRKIWFITFLSNNKTMLLYSIYVCILQICLYYFYINNFINTSFIKFFEVKFFTKLLIILMVLLFFFKLLYVNIQKTLILNYIIVFKFMAIMYIVYTHYCVI